MLKDFIIQCSLHRINTSGVGQQSLTFLAPVTSFVEGNFSTDRGGGGRGAWFRR